MSGHGFGEIGWCAKIAKFNEKALIFAGTFFILFTENKEEGVSNMIRKTMFHVLMGGILAMVLFTSACESEPHQKVRYPAVAGAFYPADALELKSMIKQFLQEATITPIKDPVIGLIAPHAGYIYSGPVAAYAYKAVEGKQYDRVVVIGPSHFEYFTGASVYDGDAYQTPLGLIPIDKEFSRALARENDLIFLSEKGHKIAANGRGEHSVEVQLPFLQVVLGKFKLVPIVMGSQSYEASRALGRALARLAKDGRTLIVASSDLSHYHPYNEAVQLDRKVITAIKEWDYYNLSRNLQARLWEACGGGPIVSLMIAAEYLDANEVRLLKYANSGDVPAGSRERVVGYSAFAFVKTKKRVKEKEFSLDKKARKILLDIAKKSVEIAVKKGDVYNPPAPDVKSLEADRGAFVTLKINGKLRGCIGYTAPIKPLYLTVRDVAIQAATADPRFTPVREDELPLLHYEISVLSPFHHVRNVDEIEVGRDGLLIKKGNHVGLLLPQVPVEWGWDRQTFLEQTCRKAGLPPDAWQDEDADLFRFTAFVFDDEE